MKVTLPWQCYDTLATSAEAPPLTPQIAVVAVAVVVVVVVEGCSGAGEVVTALVVTVSGAGVSVD